MKKLLLVLVLVVAVSCKDETNVNNQKENTSELIAAVFPEKLAKVFKTHGGLDAWKKAQILSFNKGEEVHTIALNSRKTLINTSTYTLGFNGTEVWLDETQAGSFKGNPEFYYNLYFYFYAMPFVLADTGIVYEEVAALTFEGTKYPGIKISYEANVGTSPDDNYIIYYHPESYKMAWLAYTVTFNSKEPSEKYSIIKYNSWENVAGLVLPKEITWYKKDENGMPTVPARPATIFTLPLLNEGKLSDSFFEKPKDK